MKNVSPTKLLHQHLRHAIVDRKATVGVCGLGYVGLPLALAAASQGFKVRGFDTDDSKIVQLSAGSSYLSTVSDSQVAEAGGTKCFIATGNFSDLRRCDVIVICVPTPLTRQREPNLSFVENTGRQILKTLRPGQLIVLESTTYPGTTNEILKPILEGGGLKAGRDFFLGFSPEREDPGNANFGTTTIPKVVSGYGPEARDLVALFYGAFIEKVVEVSTNDTAEAVKITENVFRAVNIALVNELKLIYDAMGIDIWEVIEAAKTKPFGYMAFYPGPGLGGHCIPIDPFYLTWKAREHGIPTRFIELAGEINTAMPRHIVSRLEEALDSISGLALSSAKILLVGLAYKKNVSDTRESPAIKLMELLERRGATIDFHDPHVRKMPRTREHPDLAGRRSVALTQQNVGRYDAALIVTDHDNVDYSLLRHCPVVVDTRNVCRRKGVAIAKLVNA